MSQHLSLLAPWEGREGTSQGQNRTREIRPSGIVGGPMETWVMGVGLRPGGKLLDTPPNPKAVARHSSIPTPSPQQFVRTFGVGGRQNAVDVSTSRSQPPTRLLRRRRRSKRFRDFISCASIKLQ